MNTPTLAGHVRTLDDLPGWEQPRPDLVHALLLPLRDVWDGDLMDQGADGWALESWCRTPAGLPARLLLTVSACGARWWAWARPGRWSPDDADAPAPGPCLLLAAEVVPAGLPDARAVLLAALDVATTDAGGV